MTELSSIPTTRRAARAQEGHRRSRRRGGARRAALAVVPLALLGSGALVYQASNAAFTANTSTGSNSWTAGNVFVTNGSSGSSLFSLTAMKPSSAAAATTKCVIVSYTGNLAANLRMYLTNFTSAPRSGGSYDPSGYVRATVEEGTGTQSDCSDFGAAGGGSSRYLTSGTTAGMDVSTLAGALTSFSSSYQGGNNASWAAPASSVGSPTTKAYRISIWLPDIGQPNAPSQAVLDDLQNSTLGFKLTWEAQNT
jgi:hypothetical protein